MSAIHKQRIHFYEFGPFRLDADERLLFRATEVVPLTPKVVDTLLVLIENRGRLLEKDVLMNAVWPDTFVEESSLSQNISLLRKALGEEYGGRQYIETLPRRGYRFTAEVREVRDDGGAFLLQRRTNSQILIEEEEETETSAEQQDFIAPLRQASTTRRLKWQRQAVIACLVLGLAAASYFWQARSRKAETGLAVTSMAVLPFKTLGAHSETEVLGLGMADALVLRLAQLDQVSVLPTSSVFKYLNREGDVLAIGRELGVDAVLDGTIQRSGDRMRVTAQLIRLSDGKTLWVGKFDEQVSDIFVVQDSVSQQLANALTFKMGDGQQLSKKRYTENAEAYELYTTGLYFWNKRTEEGLSKAIEYFKQATEKDPNYALAYASLADSYMLMGHYRYANLKREDVLPHLRAAALKAVELDPTLAEGQAEMAVVKALEGDYDAAMKQYERALGLNPSFGTAHLRYGYLLAHVGRLDEAIQHMQRAHELDPLSSPINVNLSAYYVYKGQPDLGLKYARLALETNPDAWQARVNLGEIYEVKGMYDEAEAEFKKLAEREDLVIVSKQQLAYLYALRGNRDESRKLIAEIEKAYHDNKNPHSSAYSIALVYLALEQWDDAFKWLNQAFETRSLLQPDFRYSRKLDPIRKDPRFDSLQQRLTARRKEMQESAKRKAAKY